MARERDRLLADALHEVAVASHTVGVVIDQLIAVAPVEQPLRESHADGIAEPLAERAGRGLDARGMAILRMTGRARAELAKALQLSELHLGIAGEIEQRIKQHRAMTGREHEAVPVG